MWSSIQKTVSTSNATVDSNRVVEDQHEGEKGDKDKGIGETVPKEAIDKHESAFESKTEVGIKNKSIEVENIAIVERSNEGSNDDIEGELVAEDEEATTEKEAKKDLNKDSEELLCNVSVFGNPSYLFDEISISTKDSLGPTTSIEPVFDLQEQSSIKKTVDDNVEEEQKREHKSLLGFFKTHVKTSHEKSDQATSSVVLKPPKLDQELSFFPEDSVMSFGSFQRIEKRAALKSKVEEHRLILSSKLSDLKLEKQGDTEDVSNPDKQSESLLDEPIDGQNWDPSTDLKEEVYLGLGNLMFNDDVIDDFDVVFDKNSDNAKQKPFDEPTLAPTTLFSLKNTLYIALICSLAMNVFNLFQVEEEFEEAPSLEIEEQEVTVSNVISFMLVHFKLSDKVGSHAQFFTVLLSRAFTLVTTFYVLSLIIKSKYVDDRKVGSSKQKGKFSSPTPKKILQRELSSLDKENIFPSTVTTHEVLSDGTLTEVKRTMRFSPEVKRYSPSFDYKKQTKSKTPEVKVEKPSAFASPLKMKIIQEIKME